MTPGNYKVYHFNAPTITCIKKKILITYVIHCTSNCFQLTACTFKSF